MTSEGTHTDIEDIRRRYRLIATMGLSGDLVVIAALWIVGVLPQDFLVIVTALLLAGATMMSYLFVKVLPDRIAKQRGKA
jgi:threonine/homoserine/homoserine lactone efflux protein